MKNQSLIETLKRLAILAVQFEETVVEAVHVNWTKPLSTEFSFLEDINRMDLKQMAISIMKADTVCFNHLCVQDFLEHENGPRKDIGRIWQTLSSDIKACVIADRGLGPVIGQVAKINEPQCMNLVIARLTLKVVPSFYEEL